MRFRQFVVGFLAVLSFCLTRSAWSQLTYTIPVVDKSDLGSPLKISGTASFTELIVANSVKSSSSFKVDARNVCEKAIILVLAYFDEAGPHGVGTHQVIRLNHFFWGDIAPGVSFVLARSRPGRRTSADQISPLRPADEPKAEISVQYVQFADGSTFGDETTAKDILGTRSAILDALRRLDKASNSENFLALLAQKIQPEGADTFLETFRRTRKSHGTAAARAQVHTGLTAAAAHAAAMRAVQAER
jgi:hypothetical protein